LAPDPFHDFHVGGVNCCVPLGFGFNIQNSQNERQRENLGKRILRGKGR
jgi:hypothetical protein